MVRITGANLALGRLRGAAGREKIEMVGRALYVGGEAIQAEAQISITRGAVSGARHVASLPGEPPKNDTGVLKANIEVTQQAPLIVHVSSNAPYAAALEVGTSKMAARPYMGPAARAKKQEVVALVRGAVRQALKKKGK